MAQLVSFRKLPGQLGAVGDHDQDGLLLAVQVAVSSVKDNAPDMDVRMTLPSEPVRVAVDEELVERMLQPLLDNAVRYGRSVVDVSLDRNGSLASVQIVDNGPGVADDESMRIFEPGARGEAARDSGNGAGLGLSLARGAGPSS